MSYKYLRESNCTLITQKYAEKVIEKNKLINKIILEQLWNI